MIRGSRTEIDCGLRKCHWFRFPMCSTGKRSGRLRVPKMEEEITAFNDVFLDEENLEDKYL